MGGAYAGDTRGLLMRYRVRSPTDQTLQCMVDDDQSSELANHIEAAICLKAHADESNSALNGHEEEKLKVLANNEQLSKYDKEPLREYPPVPNDDDPARSTNVKVY